MEAAGAKDQPLKVQLSHFIKSLSKAFFGGVPLAVPSSWDMAFDLLTRELEKAPKSKKVVIFLDELPWMASQRSGLLQSLDYYWNLHWSRMPHLILIVCGSAASWMLEKLIYAKGGLHQRITKKILLEPYTLKETQGFLKSRGMRLNHQQVLDLYMAIGGIPFYLKEVKKGLSAAQNIDALCFEKNGLLYNEFENLFNSLFEQGEVNQAIVRQIAKHGNRISREELMKATGIPSGGSLNKKLSELEAAGFIQSFLPFDRVKRNHFYRIIDEFSLFYLRWIEPFLASRMMHQAQGFWQAMVKQPAASSWAGYAFELICLKHIECIRKALGLEQIACRVGNWQYLPKKGSKEDGVQIDLLFDRQDGAVTLCEIKYSEKPFEIDKNYAIKLLQKSQVFETKVKTGKQIFCAMITTQGLKSTVWADELIDQQASLKDFF